MPSLTALCRARDIPDLQQRLRAAGVLTLTELADQLGVTTATIKRWQHRGQITGRRIDGRRAHLYHAGQTRPADRRRRHPRPTTTQAVTRARHDHPDPAHANITSTTSTGGAV